MPSCGAPPIRGNHASAKPGAFGPGPLTKGSGPVRANERVQTNAAGQVVLKLKTPWRGSTTHLVKLPPGLVSGWPRWCRGRDNISQ